LTWTSGESEPPDIVIDPSGNLHLVWSDKTLWSPQAFYKTSTDAGVSWTQSQALSGTSGSSGAPAISADSSGNLYLAFANGTPGNDEIYYKKCVNPGIAGLISQVSESEILRVSAIISRSGNMDIVPS
jgi:hypothetical protein